MATMRDRIANSRGDGRWHVGCSSPRMHCVAAQHPAHAAGAMHLRRHRPRRRVPRARQLVSRGCRAAVRSADMARQPLRAQIPEGRPKTPVTCAYPTQPKSRCHVGKTRRALPYADLLHRWRACRHELNTDRADMHDDGVVQGGLYHTTDVGRAALWYNPGTMSPRAQHGALQSAIKTGVDARPTTTYALVGKRSLRLCRARVALSRRRALEMHARLNGRVCVLRPLLKRRRCSRQSRRSAIQNGRERLAHCDSGLQTASR